jgi:hypothetical protein
VDALLVGTSVDAFMLLVRTSVDALLVGTSVDALLVGTSVDAYMLLVGTCGCTVGGDISGCMHTVGEDM